MSVIRNPVKTPRGCCRAGDAPAVTTVRSRLLGPDGRPIGGREIKAVLRAAPNWLSDGSGRVVETATARTDAEGWWELKLVPNRYLEPPVDEDGTHVPTSWYEIKEGPSLVSAAVVPAPGDHEDCPDPDQPCTVLLRDILIDPPSPGPIPWHPIDTLGRLHNVARDADTPLDGQALVFAAGAWRPVTIPEGASELVLLGDMHPSIHQAEPGDALVAVERDASTGRLLWGVNREAPQLEMEFGGESGSMAVTGVLRYPDVADKPVEVFWEGRLDGPRTVIDVGEWQTEHTYTTAGTYTIAYRYTDDSESGIDQITVPLP